MGKYFGTDGFRGEANVSLTAEHAFKIGRFLGHYFSTIKGDRAKILIGKDTRLSGYLLEYSLACGIVASGADAYLLHVTTTPCVAYVSRLDGFDCAAMISASHNPYYDNGIKLFNGKGEKLEDDILELAELYIDGKYGQLPLALKDKIGSIVDYASGRSRYSAYLISLGLYSFKGKKVGLDCANGSAWSIAKAVFSALGAEVFSINDEPDGTNINRNCGSTNIGALQKLVKEKELDVGFAYDGDADRCICVDEKGNTVDGDGILYLLAKYMKQHNELLSDTVVATVMSNYGLFSALEKLGIRSVKTDVGDKYVYDYMSKNGCALGGEQSGHIILSKYASTGDGILTSLKIMEVILAENKPLSELAKGFEPYPQVLINVRVTDKASVMQSQTIKAAVEKAEKVLDGKGRILVRPSGTEPLIRIMVEAADNKLCQYLAKSIEEAILLKR